MNLNNIKAFTLIELVVVVVLLGILAAVAASKMFDTSGRARAAGTVHSLKVIRETIELYKAQEGEFPPPVSFAKKIEAFLQGPFPVCQIGNRNDLVRIANTDPIVPSGTEGWAYNKTTGDFVINHADGINW